MEFSPLAKFSPHLIPLRKSADQQRQLGADIRVQQAAGFLLVLAMRRASSLREMPASRNVSMTTTFIAISGSSAIMTRCASK
ncbi:hypothetical protein AB9F34_31245 [Rhizobium leguminosarum]|uniref:hypothetical protein n=1 Tax=Rhizobium leguminosarum TaxID=384 RepID=UPI003F9823FF